MESLCVSYEYRLKNQKYIQNVLNQIKSKLIMVRFL